MSGLNNSLSDLEILDSQESVCPKPTEQSKSPKLIAEETLGMNTI